MKKFIVNVACFFVIVVVIDIIAGVVFPFLVANAKGGDNKRNNYICLETNEDILIFGSSRAIHHYHPGLISDSTGMTCYNCGQDGNGVILNYGRLLMINKRYAPKMIIYDVQNTFDLTAGEDNHKYLAWLKAYYDHEGIEDIFASVDSTEKYKMMSNLYRYNSKCVQIVSDCIHPMQSLGIKGYRPLAGKMDTMKIVRKASKSVSVPKWDDMKIAYIHKFIDATKDSKLVFVISPIWYGMDESQYEIIRTICREKNIPFYDFANNPKYVHHNEYFRDGSHMNSIGAEEFTKDLMRMMKKDKLLPCAEVQAALYSQSSSASSQCAQIISK